MRSLLFIAILLHISVSMHAQVPKTKNVVIVTLDGYRWKELFEGIDEAILFNDRYVKDTSVWRFAGRSAQERREALMPFFWNVIAAKGQLYGNRNFKSRVNCANLRLFSYPGYSEMLVGFPDPSVASNDKIENPNATVLEFIDAHDGFRNQVAAFTTWDAFPFIIREERSGIQVNSGKDAAEGEISEAERRLNEKQAKLGPSMPVRPDAMTFRYAFEFMKRERPRVVLLSFDETDSYAHKGRYDEYLKAAHKADGMIGELWQWIQSTPGYKDETTLLITTDHGRGSGRNNWRKHRLITPGSGQIWFAVMGPDTPPFGEMKFKARYYQKQVAKTIAAFLGLDYLNNKPVGEVVQTMMAVAGQNTNHASADTSGGSQSSNK